MALERLYELLPLLGVEMYLTMPVVYHKLYKIVHCIQKLGTHVF